MTTPDMLVLAKSCKQAAYGMATADTQTKNMLLMHIADELEANMEKIMEANRQDVRDAEEKGLAAAMVDRLVLDEKRILSMAAGVREVAALPDPVGNVTRMWLRPNGIQVGKQRIPLGVILMIYESRPNVTVDAAVLCLKAGNGIILRGGSEAFCSNRVLAEIIGRSLDRHGLPPAAATLVPTTDRAAMNQLLELDELIDLVIPRGGEGLIRFVAKTSRIPVIKHYKGVCHLYIDEAADLTKAINLVVDGKTSRPGVCNALETLLVHRVVAPAFFRAAVPILEEKLVRIRGCPDTLVFVPSAEKATDADWDEEFLDLRLSVRVVDSFEDALCHIQAHGSQHTEVIVTESYSAARRFVNAVQSSVVMVNASSRFSDGGQLGLGAEIGISTTKLHAYGPMGLESLTTEKFVVFGEGQTRHPV